MTTLTAPALDELEQYRSELRGFCYRMLGSTFDADDAVQETLVKAWQSWESFEGRSSLRSWLYRIASNTCLDSLRARGRRALPMDLSSPVPATTAPERTLPGEAWVEPVPDADVSPLSADPAVLVAHSESIRLAFVAALQTLPPKQRAALILKEVLSWQVAEIAELLDTSVPAVNSSLQRARATLGDADLSNPAPVEAADKELLTRYVTAFEAYDIPALVALLHHDASISMPPIAMWLRGVEDLSAWYLGFGIGCKGSRLIPTSANGLPAFGQYRPDHDNGGHKAWSLQVLEITDGAVAHIHHFLDVERIFPRFGLDLRLA